MSKKSNILFEHLAPHMFANFGWGAKKITGTMQNDDEIPVLLYMKDIHKYACFINYDLD